MSYILTLSRFLLLASSVVFTGSQASSAYAQSETLTIAAANSLKDVFRKVLPLFEAQHREITVRVVYGPSQTLRKQIEGGAPVDVFVPSLLEEIDQLERNGLVIQGTKRVYAGTALVLITSATHPAPIGSIQDLHTVPVRRIAIGDPKTSSVGKVATQFLKHSRLEPKLKSQFVLGEHSRAVLDLVAGGESEIGFVYRSDAVADPRIRILDTAPADSHTPVRYGAAVVWTARNISGADSLIEFLLSPQIQAHLNDYGFHEAVSNVGFAPRQEVKS